MIKKPLKKLKTCKVCRNSFEPRSMGHVCCSSECAISLGDSKRAKALKIAQVKDKRETKAKLDKLKKNSVWEEECRAIVQKIARIRDRNDGCISCHMPANYGGAWHGSHFRPAGNNAAVQFHLWNIHKACAQCNLFKGGNLGPYRIRLVEKIGVEQVEWLESQTQVVKTNVDYLIRFKKVMGKRMRRVERSAS